MYGLAFHQMGCNFTTEPDPVQRGLRGTEGTQTACKRWNAGHAKEREGVRVEVEPYPVSYLKWAKNRLSLSGVMKLKIMHTERTSENESPF
jgi:hypothetical protein